MHDVVRFLFPNFAAEIRVAPVEISDEDSQDTGLAPFVKRTINVNGNRRRIVQLTLRLLLTKSPSFYHAGKKVTRPIERLRIVFQKKYLLASL